MYQLSEEEYGQVLPFFEGLQVDRLAALSVIRGTYPGRIFVDRKKGPTAALIGASTCYLGGNERNAVFNEQLKDLLATEILPGLEGRPLFIFSTSDEWKNTVDELLKDYSVIRVSSI